MNPNNSLSKALHLIKDKKVLVALSGGADSVCLLYILREHGINTAAFHLNHLIRGEEADRDQLFCKELCKKSNVPFYTACADIPKLSAAQGTGIEETARNVRYHMLEKTASDIGADYIATAHNADDNIETVLFNIVRGCSVDGLCGIPFVRGNIIRPLLYSSRKEIEEYLSKKGAAFVIDSTNLCQNYTRNKIRHSVIPILKSINPALENAVANLCESAGRDKEYFKFALAKNDGVLPSRLPIAVLTRQIYRSYKKMTGKTLEYIHINEIAKRVKTGECTVLDMPGNICANIYNGSYTFTEKTVVGEYRTEIGEGLTKIPQTGTKVFYGNENVYKLATSVTVNCDKIIGGLYARQRKEGDRIKVFGVSKNVRKELINKKIPLYIRNLLPVICDSEGIVYVPYIGADDRVFSNTGQYILGLLSVETEKVNEEE